MNLQLDSVHALGYRSPSQIARRTSEAWVEQNLYCAACDSSSLTAEANNAEAVDFRCPACRSGYQLKAGKKWSENRVPDAGYDAMMRAIQNDSVPNLLVMHYSLEFSVNRLLLIPSFFFSPAAVEKRKPLKSTARRAGWVGCNILLNRIASDGKILIVGGNKVAASPAEVRQKYNDVRALAQLQVERRGWTLAVLNAIREINMSRFSISDIYEFESVLSAAYPNNNNIRPKIRQQLQVLRNMGYLRFEGNGDYSLLR